MSSSREKSMMKRSDFAQKLLDDLHLRKERLASSHRSSNASSLPADKYGYPKNGFKRSVEVKAKNTSLQGLNMLNSSSGGSKSLTRAEASNQILPFGRGHGSEKIDLSKALAFALENAGKATRVDPSGSASIISFLFMCATVFLRATKRQVSNPSLLSRISMLPTLSSSWRRMEKWRERRRS